MSNGLLTRFEPGAWNAICDSCGGTFKSYELRKDWKGLMKCKKDWEPRPTQDFVKGVPDNMGVPWSRPAPAPIFVSLPPPPIYPEVIQAKPGLGPYPPSPPIVPGPTPAPAPTTAPAPSPAPAPAPTPAPGPFTGATAGLAVTGISITGT